VAGGIPRNGAYLTQAGRIQQQGNANSLDFDSSGAQ